MPFGVADILGLLSKLEGRLANEPELGGASRVDGIRIARPAGLASSTESDLAFFFSKSFQHELPTARPGILVTGEEFVAPLAGSGLPLWKKSAVIACRDPYLAMAMLSEKFALELRSDLHPANHDSRAAVHATAAVHPTARIGAGVRIGPACVVDREATIGDRTILVAGVYVGAGSSIGADSMIFPNVSIYERVQIGARARIHSSAVIGADGFGYAPRIESGRPVGHQKIWHLGRVILGDDVEVGAATCIDRGTVTDTRVDSQAKIDNNVQVGHNAWIEEGAILCGSVGMAGSSHVGKFAYIGGAAGISNQIHVGDGARIGGMSLISKDVPAGATAVGNPQREPREYFRAQAMLTKMVKAGRKPGKASREEEA